MTLKLNKMLQIKFKIITPERIVFEDIVDQVTLPTTSGEVTILPNHIPIVSVMQPGEVRLGTGNKEELLAVSTGFIEVRPGNEVIVLADTAERAEELSVEEIEASRERAQKLMEEHKHTDVEAYAHAAAALERELARHKVALKGRKHKTHPSAPVPKQK